jgi:flagellar biogenesis protein FliO
MSPFRFVLQIAAAALLVATAASGQSGPAAPAAPEHSPPDLHRPEPAPGALGLAPQEGQALGRPSGLRGPRGGGAGRGPDGNRTLDPRISEIVRVGWALGAVVALLLVLRVMLRRLGGPLAGGGRPSGVIEVLARYPIARGQQLVLLKMSGRVVLLHQTKTGMTALSEVSDPNEVAALLARVESSSAGRGSAAGGFSSLLDRLLTASRPAPDDEFARALGATSEIGGKVVVDLTRRPRRQRSARGGGR